MLAFVIWCMTCMLLTGFGIYCFWAKKAVRFWNVQQEIKVRNVEKYNRAVGKLFIAFSIVLTLLGIPLLKGQNSADIIITIMGPLPLSIFVMVIYTRIEAKYRIL